MVSTKKRANGTRPAVIVLLLLAAGTAVWAILWFWPEARLERQQARALAPEPPRPIDRAAPVFALFPKHYGVIQCEAVTVGKWLPFPNRPAWRIVTRSDRPKHVEHPEGVVWRLVERNYAQYVLIPDEYAPSPWLKTAIQWERLDHFQPVRTWYLGTGNGYRWFGRMSLKEQHSARRQFKLQGGENELWPIHRYLRKNWDTYEFTSAIYMLSDLGEAAIPVLQKEMQKAKRDISRTKAHSLNKRHYIADAIRRIPGQNSIDILLAWYNDPDLTQAVRSVLIAPPVLPEAKHVYLDAINDYAVRGEGPLRALLRAIQEFNWTEAAPTLQRIVERPRYMWNYYESLCALRRLQGRPMPDEVLHAVNILIDDCPHNPSRLSESEVEQAATDIVHCPDTEAAVAAAVYIATAYGGKPGCRINNARGIEMCRQLPREPVVRLLKLVISATPYSQRSFHEESALAALGRQPVS